MHSVSISNLSVVVRRFLRCFNWGLEVDVIEHVQCAVCGIDSYMNQFRVWRRYVFKCETFYHTLCLHLPGVCSIAMFCCIYFVSYVARYQETEVYCDSNQISLACSACVVSVYECRPTYVGFYSVCGVSLCVISYVYIVVCMCSVCCGSKCMCLLSTRSRRLSYCCLLSTRSRRCRVITGSVVGLLGVSDVCINTSCALFAVCVC